uniref:Uncharacterized protein n=1 Tax=Physcomitrium patens TaxID=3218 RepID=A0A2K1K2D1_PHYPA|nr:hypothetical protein PHYPA_012412 [Physcomitrium patens]
MCGIIVRVEQRRRERCTQACSYLIVLQEAVRWRGVVCQILEPGAKLACSSSMRVAVLALVPQLFGDLFHCSGLFPSGLGDCVDHRTIFDQ